MNQKLAKPPLYRLTLTIAGCHAFATLMARQKKPHLNIAISRPDGRYDVGISMALLDQMQTAALPKENLSDTLLRIVGSKT